MSNASISSSSLVSDGSPRRATAARTWAGEARNNFRSITILVVRHAFFEAAISAIEVAENFEIDPAPVRRRRGVDGQHVQLRVIRRLDAEGADAGGRGGERDQDAVLVHHDSAVSVVARGRRNLDGVVLQGTDLEPRHLAQLQ